MFVSGDNLDLRPQTTASSTPTPPPSFDLPLPLREGIWAWAWGLLWLYAKPEALPIAPTSKFYQGLPTFVTFLDI
jgi:hypothetical protein